MITYNHEKYIAEAIQGVLMQEVDFDINLIIANDCSIDQTQDIISEIIKVHPESHLIRYFHHQKNLGMMPNFLFALRQCVGKYIALCEGDDYWTDPLKLQKQVDFLEKNQDVNICFHRAHILMNSKFILHEVPSPFVQDQFDYIELLKYYNFISTASVVFRRPDNLEFPGWFNELQFGDLGLYKIVSDNKQIQCLDENMSVYRSHNEGVYSGLGPINAKKNYLRFYKRIQSVLNDKEKDVVTIKIKDINKSIAKIRFPKNNILQKLYISYLNIKTF